MADIIDINIYPVIETVDLTIEPNLTTININTVTGGGGGAVSSVNTQTGDVVLNQDDVLDGTTYKQYSLTEKNKLAGIAAGAEVNVNADWNATTGDAQILNKPTIPSITNLVPYSGANQNVNLGEYEIKAGQLTLDTTPTGTAAVATTQWNDSVGVSETTLKGGNVILKNGIDLVARIVNKVTPNTTLTKAAYQVVRISGAQGQRLAVELAQANNDNNSADTLGIVIETIPTNQEGFIITMGQIEGINTTGSLQGETWSDGDVLYLSPSTAGRITNIKPTGAIGHIVIVGYVEHSHITQGKIYVKIMNGWELDELHNVYINTPLNNQSLVYETSTQLWKNKTLDKTFVGLGNVDNTSDLNKPISTATQTALDLKVDKVTGSRLITSAESTLLGNTSGTNTGDETTATIKTKLGITTLSGSNTGDQDLSSLAPKASPTFTGTVTTPAIIVSSEIASTIASFDASKNIKSLDTATYPTLTELSYAKGVTSAIQTQINSKVTQNTWVDYSATSTIVGWSSFTVKNIRYYVVGKIVTVFYQLNGTSNSTTTTFTLPFANANNNVFYPNAYTNNGVSGVAAGRTRILTGDSFATMAIDWSNTAFSAIGSKTAAGTIIYEIA